MLYRGQSSGESSLSPPVEQHRRAGHKRKLEPAERATPSDYTDDECSEVTSRPKHIHIQAPSSSPEASSPPFDVLAQERDSSPPYSTTEHQPETDSISIPDTMAVPPEITVKNMSGTYLLNRTLSDSSQTVLKMQSVNFAVRTAVAYSNVTVTLSQYTDDKGPHLDQDQVSTGGIKNFEDRIMDGALTEKYNWIWGKVLGKSRYVKIEEITDGFLREGWSKDCIDGELVEGYVEYGTEKAKEKWTALQIWGFAEVDGERRHVRKILATKPGWKDQRIRMVYDWKTPA